MGGSLSDIENLEPFCEYNDDCRTLMYAESLCILCSNRILAYAIQNRTPRKSAPLPGLQAEREIMLQETWLHLNTKVNSDPVFDFRICELVSND